LATNSKDAQARAEASFKKKEIQLREGAKAMAEYQAAGRAEREKTARLKLLREAKQAAADGPIPRGRITVGALETATAVRLPPILAAYVASCPEVDIEIATGTSAALIEAVLARQLEVAFVAGPVHHPELAALPRLPVVAGVGLSYYVLLFGVLGRIEFIYFQF